LYVPLRVRGAMHERFNVLDGRASIAPPDIGARGAMPRPVGSLVAFARFTPGCSSDVSARRIP
jgi:hypothetical protein